MNTCDHVQPSAYMRYFTNLFPFIKAWSTHDIFAFLCPKPKFDVTCGALAGKVTRAQSERRLNGPTQRYKTFDDIEHTQATSHGLEPYSAS